MIRTLIYIRILACAICLVSLVTGSFAQKAPYTFELVPIQDGEFRLVVTSILQDRDGFLWFGTNKGLYKYDGYKFTHFGHDPNNPNSLSDKYIRTIYEDRSGFIWAGTNSGGLNRLDKTNGSFKHYIPESGNPNEQSSSSVWAIHQDQTGSLWFGTRSGLYKLNVSSGDIKYFNINPDLETPFIRAISEDSHSNLWVGSSVGLCNVTFDQDSSFNFNYIRNQITAVNPISSNTVRSVLVDDSDNIWFGTKNGVSCYDQGTGQVTRYLPDGSENSLSHASISGIYEDNDGALWIGTDGGGVNQFINKDNPSSARFIHYTNDPLNPKSIQTKHVWTVFQDASGLYWIGTDSGLYKLITTSSEVVTYTSLPQVPESLSDNTVMAVLEDRQGILWVGTANGLNRLEPNPDRLAPPVFTKYFNQPSEQDTGGGYFISDIHQSEAGDMWVGTKDQGLHMFNPETGASIVYRNEPGNLNSLSSDAIRCILEYPAGTLWIGTRKGLNKLDIGTSDITTYLNDPGNSQSISGNTVLCMYLDRSQQMWIGTRNGLNKFDPNSGKFKAYNNSPNPALNLTNLTITSLYENASGTLWIGTSKGLIKLDKSLDKIISLSGANQLPIVNVKNILEDKHENLWLNTDQGLIKYNPISGLVKSYLSGEDLDEIKTKGAFYKSKNGEFFRGGVGGMKRFYPENFKDNHFVPPVVVTDFQVFNSSIPINDTTRKKPILTQHITHTKGIELSHSESIFSFEFSALSYLQPEKNQFKYKMEGFHDDWITTHSNKRFATFTNLDPGEYVFRVIASNNDGIWNEDGTSILLKIHPPPWKSWWAYFLYTLVGIGLIYTYLQFQRNKLKLKQKELEREQLLNERLQHADKLKDEFLANTSHELRTPLNGIIGIAESLYDGVEDEYEDLKPDLSLLISSGKRLSSLVNSILDFSKLKTHDLKLNLVPLDLRSLVNVVLRMGAPLIEGKDLEFVNRIPKDAPSILADENRIMQILNNLIGNAIKFTETGMIKVSSKSEAGMMVISVADTGIGITEDKLDLVFKAFEQIDSSTTRQYVGSGLGLSISKQLIELHGGKIRIESKVGKGSVFTFTIPISTDEPVELQQSSQISKIRFTQQKQTIESEKLESDNEIRILVVDDEAVNQKVLSNHLEKGQYDVTTAFNGEEALLALEHMGKFDLVLLDVMMPKMSGFEVCQKLREQFSPAELPVVIITAKDQLTDLVKGFSSGANDYIVKPFSRDEFLSRVKTHLELHKINAAYSRFIPMEFLKSLGRESIIDVKLGDQIQQEITVFFCDIRAYSQLSESMTPKENFNFLNAFLGRVAPLIKDHNGFINQFLGDGVMALFLKSAEDSVRASIAVQKALREYNKQRIKNKRDPIEIGIGLHNGPLMMGIIGVEERMDPGVVSDTVNTAARMEGLTKFYGASIVVSQDTLAKIENLQEFHFRALGKVQVKGKNVALKIYEIYDADPPEILALKQKIKKDFESGLYHFLNKNFPEAAIAFKAVLKVYPDDKASVFYMERSAEYMVKGVPDKWFGIESMDHK